MPKEHERDILKSIVDYLNLRNFLFVRNGTGSFKTEKGGWFKTGAAGSPDLLVFLKGGQCIGLEVKTPKGKLRPSQEGWKSRAENIGMRYEVVRSLDDVIKILK